MRISFRPGLALAVALLASVCGCGKPPSGRAYTVQGVIRQLPEASRPASDLYIQHEPIHHMVGQDGREIDMEAMTMPFPLASGVSLRGLRIGDPVVFTLVVDWQGSPPYQITRLERTAGRAAP